MLKNIIKKVAFITPILFVLAFFVIEGDVARAAEWVTDSTSCSAGPIYGQSCSGDDVICGISASSIIYCGDTSVLQPPAGPTTVDTENSAAQVVGGYYLDCQVLDNASNAPACQYSTGYWYCNRDSVYYNKHVETVCSGGLAASSTPGNCISGYAYCDGSKIDADGCEVQSGVTNCSAGANNNLNGSCTCVCDANYNDCDGTGAGVGNGCEVHNGDACSIGGLSGTVSGCFAGAANCQIPVQNFQTGVEAKYSTTTPLLRGTQYGSGDLLKLLSMTASTTGGVFNIKNDGRVGIGTDTLGDDNMLTVGYDPSNQFIINKQGEVIDGVWKGSFIGLAYGGTGLNLASSTGFLYVSNGLAATTTIDISKTDLTAGSGLTWSSLNTLALNTTGDWTGTIDGVGFSSTLNANSMWYGSAGATPNELAIGTEGQLLIVNGGAPAWASTSTLGIDFGDLVGLLSTGQGGTGWDSSASSGFAYINNGIWGASSTIGVASLSSLVMVQGENISLLNNNLNFIDLAAARSGISESISGIAYNGTTGEFTLTAGYEVPLTASTSNWNTSYNWTLNGHGNWDLAYTTVNASSTNWTSAYDSVAFNGANWNTAYGWTNAGHSDWDTAYIERAQWDGGATNLNAATARTSLELDSMALLANTGSSTIITVGTIGTGLWQGSAIATQYGGTGQNFANVATGSLIYFSDTGVMDTLAKGNIGDVLKIGAAGLEWVIGTSTTASHGIIDALHTGTAVTGALTAGDLFYYNGADWTNLATSSLGLLTTDITEGTNLYFTDARASTTARLAISVNGVGLTYSSATGVIGLDGNYNIPKTASTTEWSTAFGWGNHADANYFDTDTDVLTVAMGGTGTTTFAQYSLVYASAANTIGEITTSGHIGKILQVDATGKPVWASTSTLGMNVNAIGGTLSVENGGTGTSSASWTGFAYIDGGVWSASNTISYSRLDDLVMVQGENISLLNNNLNFIDLTAARSGISESISGIAYNGTTGEFTLTAGYELSTTASTTNWNNAYNIVNASSTNWNTSYNWTLNGHGNWDLAYTAVNASSTQWGNAYDWTNVGRVNWDAAYSERRQWDGGATSLNAATARISLELDSMALLANTGSSTIITVGTIGTGLWQGSAIATQYGGTGQNFANVATGSLIYFSDTGVMSTLAKGGNGQILQISGLGLPAWVNSADATGLHQLLGEAHDATTTGAILAGDIVYRNTAGEWTNIATSSLGLASSNHDHNASYLIKSNNLSDLTSSSTARVNLGLVVGTDIQAFDAELASLAGLSIGANQLIYGTGANTYGTTTLTAFAITLLDDTDSSTARTTLGLGSLATLNAINNDNWLGVDLAVVNGGTGTSTAASAGYLLMGDGAGGYTFVASTSIGDPTALNDADFAANGIMVRTDEGSYEIRSATGTADQIIVTNGDGVAGNPTFALSSTVYLGTNGMIGGDIGNVINFSIDDSIGFNTGGTQWMLLDAAGNLMMGTSTPGAKLTVMSDTGSQLRLSYDADTYVDFHVASDGAFTIDGSDLTGSLLTIGSGQAADAGMIFDGESANDYWMAVDYNSNILKIGTSSTVGAGTILSILQNGNIGIGTTSPSARFTIGGVAGAQFLVSNAGVISDGTWNADTIGAQYGGTGQNSSAWTGFAFVNNGTWSASNTISAAKLDSLVMVQGENISLLNNNAGYITTADISESILGIDYSSGAFSLTSGYNIPLTASTTNWNTAYNNRITSASSPLSISDNNLTISMASSSANGYLTSADWTTFNNKWDALSDMSLAQGNIYVGDGSGHPAASSALFVNTNGYIGIGTTTPAYLLDVYGNYSGYLASIYNATSTASAGGLFIRSDGLGNLLTLNYNGTDVMTVTGAETTFNNPVNFGSVGDVSIANNLLLTNAAAGNLIFSGPGYLKTESAWQNLDLTLSAANLGDVVIDDSMIVSGTTTIADLLYANYASGRVGIGTNVPSALFHIDGNSTELRVEDDSYPLVTLYDDDVLEGMIYTSASDMYVQSQAGKLFLGVNSNSGLLTLTSSTGFVGIGTTSPVSKLAVVGDTYLNGDLTVTGAGTFGTTTVASWNKVKIVDGNTYSQDSTGIQAAINSLGAEGGKVFLPSGTYSVTATITIPSFVWLDGAGASSTVLRLADNTNTAVLVNADFASGNEHIKISDLKIDGNRSSNTGVQLNGVYFDGVDKSVVDNVAVVNCEDDGIYFSSGTKNSVVDGSYFENNTKAIHVGDAGTENNTIVNNIAKNSGGIYVGWYVDNTIVSNNTVHDSQGYGVMIEHSLNIAINNNSLFNNAFDGIDLTDSDYCVVSGNNLDGNGGTGSSDAIDINGSDNNIISANIIVDAAGTGQAIDIDSTSMNNVITSNSFSGTGADSINDLGTNTRYNQPERIKLVNMATTSEVAYSALYVQATTSGALIDLRQTGSGNIVNIFDDANEVFTILNGGNVGIGDASPASLFTVGNGDLFQINSNGYLVNQIVHIGDAGTVSYADGDGDLYVEDELEVDGVAEFNSPINVRAYLNMLDNTLLSFGSGDDVRMQFDTGQTNDSLLIGVGVGTAGQSGNILFIANGDIDTDFAHAVSDNPTLYIQSADETSVADYLKLWHDQTNGNIDAGAGSLNLMTGGTAALTIDSSQSLGIGTTSPLAKLDVYGNVIFSGANRYLNFGSATGTDGYGFYDNGGVLQLKNSSGSYQNLTTLTAAGTTGYIPYFAADGNTLTATSALTIESDGNINMPSWNKVITVDGTKYTKTSTGIQQAISALGADGGKIFLSEGIYTMTATVTIPSFVWLDGAGASSTVLRLANGANTSVLANADATNGNSYIKISNLKIDGNDAGNTGATCDGIRFVKVSDSAIENIFIYDAEDYGIYKNSGSNLHIANNKIYSSGNYGVYVYREVGGLKLVNNAINNNAGGGLYLQGPVQEQYLSNVVSGNIFENNSVTAIYLYYAPGNIVSNNTINGLSISNEYGIVVANSDSNSISGNRINRMDEYSILLNTTSANNVITGNVIDVYWADYGIGFNDADNNIVSNNNIDGPANNIDGIKISNDSDSNIFTANTIHGFTGGYGIDIEDSTCENTVFSGNVVINNALGDIHDLGTNTRYNQPERIKLVNTATTSEVAYSALYVQATTSGALIDLRQTGSGDIMNIYKGATQAFTIDENGYVGIGTDAPDYLLDVAGNIGISDNLIHNGDTNTLIGFLDDMFQMQAGGETLVELFEGVQDYVKLGDGGDVDLNFNDMAFLQGSSGYLGIGTTSPLAKLDVYGNVIFSGANRYLNFGAVSGSSGYGLYDNGGVLQLKNSGGSYQNLTTLTAAGTTGYIPYFAADGNTLTATSALFIADDGKIGIGTETPNSTMDIIGSLNVQGGVYPVTVGNWDPNDGNVMSSARAIFVSGNYAYVAGNTSNNLAIVDISNPSAPITVGNWDPNDANIMSGARSVFVSGKYAYVGGYSSNNLAIVDISNPSAPITVGNWDPDDAAIMAWVSSVYVSGKYAYVAAAFSSNFAIIDISDPANPQMVGNWDPNDTNIMNSARSIRVNGKYAYISGNLSNNMAIVDISNPANPTMIGNWDPNDANYANNIEGLYISDKYAYIVSNTGNNMAIVDISNPANPTTAGNWKPDDANIISLPNSVTVAGKYAYVTGGSSDNLAVVDISSSTNPTTVGNWDPNDTNVMNETRSVFVTGKYAYAVGSISNNIAIVDMGGIETQNLLAGTVNAGTLMVNDNAIIENNLYIQNGLNVGIGGLYSQGGIFSYVSSSTAANAVSAAFMGGNVGIGNMTPEAVLDITGVSSTAVSGSEMITNAADRDFSSNTGNWDDSSTWMIFDGKLNHATSSTATTSLNNAALSAAPVTGKTYKIVFVLNTTATGTMTMSIGGTNGVVIGKQVNSETHEMVVIAANSSPLIFTPDANWLGTLDSISVKEITPSQAAQIVRNSDGSIGLEFRSGGIGLYNSFLGLGSGRANTTGTGNSAVGNSALYSNTTGSGNAAFGNSALYYNTSGSNNTAGGLYSLMSNTIGNANTAYGGSALSDNISGYNNTASGYQSLRYNVSGHDNTANGQRALYLNSSGSYNVAYGSNALLSNSTGAFNVANGYSSLAFNSTGHGNVAIGYLSGTGTGAYSGSDYNTIIGYQAGSHIDDNQDRNVLIGYQAGYDVVGSDKLYIANGSADANVLIYGNFAEHKLGIGTTTPTQTLSVAGTSTMYALGLNNGSQTAPSLFFNSDTDSGIYYTGSKINFTIGGNDIMSIGANNIELANGSASNPAYTFTSQNNIGMYYAGTDRLGFSTGGGMRMLIDANGRVGIGTSSPLSQLDVYGNLYLSGASRYINFGTSSVAGSSGYGIRDNGGMMEFKNAAGTWKEFGNVDSMSNISDINVTSQDNGDLLVYDSVTAKWVDRATSTLGLIADNDFAANGIMVRTAAGTYTSRSATGTTNQIVVTNGDGVAGNPTISLAEVLYLGSNGKIGRDADNLLNFATDNQIGFNTNGAQRMLLDASGNLAIGTTSAAAKLTVLSGTGAQLRLAYDADSFADFTVDNNGQLTIASNGFSATNIGTGDGALYVDDAGNIGIGTSSPVARLDIWGKLNEDILSISSTSGTQLVVMDSEGNLGLGTNAPSAKLHLYKSNGTNADVMLQVSTSTGIGFKVMGDGEAISDQAFNSTGADYAEYFLTKNKDLQAGETVCVDILANNSVKRCERGADPDVMGIVSTKPAIVGNYQEDKVGSNKHVIVGMLGQVPAFVVDDNGAIRPGDSLTSASSTPGFLMKANAGDSTVGVALESFDGSSGKIKVLISRRNKSLTVETVEEKVAERIAAMAIEDDVRVMIADSLESLNVDDQIKTTIANELNIFDSNLTIRFDGINDRLTNIASDKDGLIARLAIAEENIATVFAEQNSIMARLAEIDNNLMDRANGLTIDSDGRLVIGETETATSTETAKNIEIKATEGIKIGNNISTTSESEVAIVEIDVLSDANAALVINQAGDGDVADFRSDDVSIVNIADSGRVTIVGELFVDGRLMICSNGACGTQLDSAVDETAGDMGVEGKVVAGAFESVCDEGMIWVEGSAKYGTLPGFCVMADEATGDSASTNIDDNQAQTNISQGEASMNCQKSGYHLLAENEWMTIADSITRNNDNDFNQDADGLQLITTCGMNVEQSECLATSTHTLTNGNIINNFVGGVAEWTDKIITRADLPATMKADWNEYFSLEDAKGLDILPPYYYDSTNGIGQLKTGTSTESNLRGFVRGERAVFDLDLSHSPALATSTIGFRCAK